jgi:hypothetical protein
MAGALTISTLNNDAGVLATQNGMTGIAKAWVNFNGTGTVAIRDSFNGSSITDNGTGDYTVNFTTAMPNANYSVQQSFGSSTTAVGDNVRVQAITSMTTTAVRSLQVRAANASVDWEFMSVAVFSS